MPRYQVTAEGLEDVWVSCPGCSGDALSLALKDRDLQGFKVHRRSGDGRQWWFDVTFGPGQPGAGGEGSGTRVVSVSRIDD
jgi:hypothetical protein